MTATYAPSAETQLDTHEVTNQPPPFAGIDAFADDVALREALEALTRMIGPMMPHLAEELWQRLGHDSLLADQPWPEADGSLVTEESVTIAVQVNGKLRATIELPRDCDQSVAEERALAAEGVQRILEGKAPRKVIVVPNRVVNIVA